MAKAKSKAAYMISAVAEQYEIHPQTLRLYEREGLLKPSRSDGNTRLYTDEDLERLEVILHLTRDLGVNLAGVEIILNMREKMGEMQAQIEEFVATLESRTGAAPLGAPARGSLMRIVSVRRWSTSGRRTPARHAPVIVRYNLGTMGAQRARFLACRFPRIQPRATLRYVAPFAGFVGIMALEKTLSVPPAIAYTGALFRCRRCLF